MGRRGRRIAAVGLAVAAVVSACSGDDDTGDDDSSVTVPVETSESTTTEGPTTTEDPDAAVKEDVEEAYLAYWDALLQIYGARNPGHPLIEQVTTGEVREAVVDAISQDITDGRSIRPPEDPAAYHQDIIHIEVEGDRATVTGCVVDGAVVVDNRSGAILNDAIVTLLMRSDLTLSDGLWRVARNEVDEKRDGTWDCNA